MAKIICPVCKARVPLPKRRRPLSGPGPGRAYDSPLCPSCDADLSERIAEHRALRKRRRLGVFAKAMILFTALGILCLAGGLMAFDADPNPASTGPLEQAFRVGTQVFLALGMLMKLAYRLFEEEDRLA